jgi:hypothetical protein
MERKEAAEARSASAAQKTLETSATSLTGKLQVGASSTVSTTVPTGLVLVDRTAKWCSFHELPRGSTHDSAISSELKGGRGCKMARAR